MHAKTIQPQPNVVSPSRQPIKETYDVPDTAKVDENIPVSLYRDRFHKPYAAEFFGLPSHLLMELDKETMSKVDVIDQFALEQITSLDLKDDKKSYNTVLNKIMKILDIDDNEKPKNIINKLYTVISLRSLLK